MADRRMFAMTIADSDAFIELSLASQALYFHLGMRADDDGFVNSPLKIVRMIRAKKKDLDELIQKNFIIAFESGVVVIKHWCMNNYLRNDRYKSTVYQEELKLLSMKENKAYTLKDGTQLDIFGLSTNNQMDTNGIPHGNQLPTKRQPSIGKVSIGKKSISKEGVGKTDPAPFIPPTLEQVRLFKEEQFAVVNGSEEHFISDPETYFNQRKSVGWKTGKFLIVDWQSDFCNWELRERKFQAEKKGKEKPDVDIPWLQKCIDEMGKDKPRQIGGN